MTIKELLSAIGECLTYCCSKLAKRIKPLISTGYWLIPFFVLFKYFVWYESEKYPMFFSLFMSFAYLGSIGMSFYAFTYTKKRVIWGTALKNALGAYERMT